MKNSIEETWKQGFLNEKSLIAPKINDLYNRKSKLLVYEVQRRNRFNLILIFIMSILFPIVLYFLDAVWQGATACVLLLLISAYNNRELRAIRSLDEGATSLDYLRSLDRWLKDALRRGGKIARFYYPLCFLIAMSIIWSAWNKAGNRIIDLHAQQNSAVNNIPVFAIIAVCSATALMFYFGDKIYQWDVNLMYGRVFRKLEAMIGEMEQLKED
jgi:hypothetical protein